MMFRVTARIGLVNGSDMDVEFSIRARDENDVTTQVTPQYVLTNVGNDWAAPIENVTVLKAEAISIG
jgi:hypothetical protein